MRLQVSKGYTVKTVNRVVSGAQVFLEILACVAMKVFRASEVYLETAETKVYLDSTLSWDNREKLVTEDCLVCLGSWVRRAKKGCSVHPDSKECEARSACLVFSVLLDSMAVKVMPAKTD